MRFLVVISLIAVIAFAGCKKDEAKTNPTPNTATPAAATDELDLDTSYALALSEPTGDKVVDTTIIALQERLSTQPKHLDSWIALGRSWIQKARRSADEGFYLSANACADIAEKLSPGNPLALNLRAIVKLNEHDFAGARDVAARITKEFPEDAMAWGTMSDAEIELGNYDAATDAAQKMLDIKPNLPSYSRAAYLKWLHGDLAGAKEVIASAFDAGRGHKDKEPSAFVLVDAATFFWKQGDVSGAEAGFDMALKEFPGFAPALVGKARVALAKGQPKVAITLLEQAWSKRPLVETAWLLGDAKTAAGDAAGAKAAYANVVRTGKLSDAKTLAAFYATRNEHIDEALALIDGEAKTRGGVFVDDIRAWALFRAGRFDEARKFSDRAMRLGTPDPTILFHAGSIQIKTGDEAAGRALVQRALKMNPLLAATVALAEGN